MLSMMTPIQLEPLLARMSSIQASSIGSRIGTATMVAGTPIRLAPALLALLVLLQPCRPAGAAEDCSDLARIPDCPPPPSPCLGSPCPPQDCSTCTAAFDDDGDCALDEEILNGVDDDQDGLIDEDISCLDTCDPLNYACPVTQIAAGDLQVPAQP